MKTLTLILFFGINGAAAAGYENAVGALKNVEEQPVKELDTLLEQPGAALAKNARATALLGGNQAALELFRQAAEEPNAGYMFAPKPEKPGDKAPAPKFGAHVKLFKLLLIDAKIKAARKQTGPAEKDLLAAAGFLAQLSAQKSGILSTSLVECMYLQKAYPVLSASLRGASASPAYLKELSALLDNAAKNQDFMRAALLEQSETAMGTVRSATIPAMLAEFTQKGPFWNRLPMKRLMDKEFISIFEKEYRARVDMLTGAWSEAFQANDPGIAKTFLNKRVELLNAREKALGERTTWAKLIYVLAAGTKTKTSIAGDLADIALFRNAKDYYSPFVTYYSVSFCELNVLRSALAVKLYQRGRRRMPDSLDQLVPAFLSEVPRDSFNKLAPLSYVKTGKKFAVYSFGPDGRDGKGTAELDYGAYAANPSRDAGDIVFADQKP